MSANTDYLDRLKTIREKYGCSQPKTQTTTYLDSHVERPTAVERTIPFERSTPIDRSMPFERTTATNYYKPDTYALDRMKVLDNISTTSGALGAKNTDYNLRPHSSIGLATGLGAPQSYQGLGDYTRKAEREKEIEQIRQNYAASRRKVIEDFSAKSYTRDYSKEVPKDFTKGEKDYLKDYTRASREQLKPQLPIASTKIDLLNRAEESVSPIKRMSDYEQKKSYRGRELETPDTFWKQRQAKLSQLAVNRLNENPKSSLLKEDKYGGRRSGLYEAPKTYEQAGLPRRDAQNRADGYSVNNIDRIQQRIQSILAKK